MILGFVRSGTMKTGNEQLRYEQCLHCSKPANNVAQILPCWHVFCGEACLKSVAALAGDGQPYCGKCKQKFPSNQVEKGQLKELLRRKLRRDDVVPQCNMCDGGGIAVSFCSTCNYKMCEICAKYHPTCVLFKGHQVHNNLEQVKSSEFEQKQTERRNCKLHKKMEAKYFCRDCQSKACDECKHRHSKVVTIKDEIANFDSKIASSKNAETTIGDMVTNLNQKLESLENSESIQFEAALESLMKRARQKCDSALKKRNKELLAAYKEATQVEKQEVLQKIQLLERAMADASHLQNVHAKASSSLEDTGILNTAWLSFASLESLGSITNDILQKRFDSPSQSVTLTDAGLDDIEKTLSKLGCIDKVRIPFDFAILAKTIYSDNGLSPAPRSEQYVQVSTSLIQENANGRQNRRTSAPEPTASSSKFQGNGDQKILRERKRKDMPDFITDQNQQPRNKSLPSNVGHDHPGPHAVPGASTNKLIIKNIKNVIATANRSAMDAEVEKRRKRKALEEEKIKQKQAKNQ